LESVSAFFPAYNDAATIGGLVETTIALLRDTGRRFEVIVVDDGSKDDTPRVLQQLRERYGHVLKVVRHPVNRGYGGALRSGFSVATMDFVFYTDGDGQYDPSELSLLLEKMTPGVGLVNGYKIKRHDPYHRVVIGKMYNQFVRLLFRFDVWDVDCDFRLMRRSFLSRTYLRSESGAICAELLSELQMLGCKVVNVPVHHYERTSGQSQFFHWRSIFSSLQQLFSVYFRRRPRKSPSAAELLEPNSK
jgi:glycosyltransferase involved in cell wall biosynthesis